MKKRVIYCILAVFTAISSCETDFDVNQDWTEIPVIYGLLNQADSITYVRVQKAFLGDGDAFVFAGINDSIYYQNVIDVKIEEWDNGNLVSTEVLTRDSTVVKDTGLFANNPHVLFKTGSAFTIDDESKYRLEVSNSQSGNVATASTEIVENLIVSRPPASATAKIRLTGGFPYVVTYLPGQKSKIVDMIIRFFYLEVNKANPSIRETKYVDWFFPSKIVTDPENPSTQNIEIASGAFYTFLASQLDEDLTIDRFYCHLDFMFSVGAEDLNTYIEVNQPPLGVVQEKPEFTNIEGGLGLFSSRFNFVVPDKQLDSESALELEEGDETKDLGFIGGTSTCQ